MTATKTAPKTTKAPVAEKTPRAKKVLRKPMARILEVLNGSTSKNGVEIKALLEKAKVEPVWGSEFIFGRRDPEKRKIVEEKHGKSLLTLGFVKEHHIGAGEIEEYRYSITPAGKKALADHKAAEKAKA